MGTPRKLRKNCKTCDKLLKSLKTVYCNNSCQMAFKWQEYIRKWKLGEVTGADIQGELSSHVRRYILNKYNCKCMFCGWNEKNPKSGTSPLAVDHIDGNHQNNVEENLRLLCPNCHSLTPTYGNLNAGNGRPRRRKKFLQI